MLFKFPKQLILKDSDMIFNYIQDGYFKEILNWIIHSRMREAVSLKGWLKKMVDNPTPLLLSKADAIASSDDPDVQVMDVLKYVQSILTYTSDLVDWRQDDYWQDAETTIRMKKGDCEDGAILAYVLCRLKGVHSNRLLLFTGDVAGGGHCWLGYRPTEYPLNWVFLDWCYWFSPLSVEDRNKFWIDKDKIFEYDNEGHMKFSNYFDIWFAFNEDVAFLELNYSVKNRV